MLLLDEGVDLPIAHRDARMRSGQLSFKPITYTKP